MLRLVGGIQVVAARSVRPRVMVMLSARILGGVALQVGLFIAVSGTGGSSSPRRYGSAPSFRVMPLLSSFMTIRSHWQRVASWNTNRGDRPAFVPGASPRLAKPSRSALYESAEGYVFPTVR